MQCLPKNAIVNNAVTQCGVRNEIRIPKDKQRSFYNHQFKYPSIMDKKRPHLKRKFTPREDQMLIEIVNKYIKEKMNRDDINANDEEFKFTPLDWREISQQMKTKRNPRQCSERYLYYLSPSVNNGPWSIEEDEFLINKYEELGPQWKKISEFFPKRTEINVKNHFNLLNRRRLKREKKKLKNQTMISSDDTSNIAQNYFLDASSEIFNLFDGENEFDIETNEFWDSIMPNVSKKGLNEFLLDDL